MNKTTINCKGKLVELLEPKVMGILNLTPDSFYDGGKYEKNYLSQVEKMLSDGAAFIDLGAMSSRPGSQSISEQEELDRLIMPMEAILKEFPDVLLSIDTFRGKVAEEAIIRGACLINDISAGKMDDTVLKIAAQYQLPYVLMHMQGEPKSMQQAPIYDNVTAELIRFFSEKILLLKQMGIKDIIIDPGFGFGKDLNHNYTLLRELHEFQILEMPLMVGISRKSIVNKVLNTKASEALNGTTALHMIALQKGAKILRVHDVKEATQCIQLHMQIESI